MATVCAADKRYDLDFKTPNNSGAEVKSGDEMIELYKSFCKGTHSKLVFQQFITANGLVTSSLYYIPLDKSCIGSQIFISLFKKNVMCYKM